MRWPRFLERKDEVLALHALATNYHQRPSAVLGIDDPYTAYQFDLAVLVLAAREQEAKAPKSKGGRKAPAPPRKRGASGFADPSGLALAKNIRSMKLPESGTW